MKLTITPLLAVDNGGGIELVPDMSELVMGLVAFLLLLVAMIKFVFPKVNETLAERSASIEGKLEEADSKLTEAAEAKKAYEAEIATSRGEANQVIEEARTTAEQLRADIVAKAESEAAAIVERAQADIQAERDRVLSDLRTQVGALSVQLASRIVEREVDQATHEGLVDDYIQRLSSQN